MPAPAPTVKRGYATAAPVYLDRGWTPLPLPPGMKTPPPTGFTGEDGRTPTVGEIAEWCTTHANGNIALRMGQSTVGIDVDVYGDKRGDVTLATLVAAHGPLPATWSSTSRGPGESKIHFFLIPEGTKFPGMLGDGIEIIQNGHRYAVVAPSTHPDTGDRYRWYTPAGEVATQPPAVNDLAALPAAWVEALRWKRPSEPITHKQQPITDDSIAERINREHDWHNVLLTDGWYLSKTLATETRWARPGKTKDTSGVLHEPDGPFNVFTTSVAALQRSWALDSHGVCWSYSMFGYLAATRYDGNRSECARDYRKKTNAVDAQHHTLTTATIAVVVLDDVVVVDDDWASIGLSGIATLMRSGDYQPIRPTMLAVRDSIPLLYGERINSLFGESGGGKTWVALAALIDMVRSGRRVLFIDYEDNANGITERLVLLGLSNEEIELVDYRNPTSGIGFGVAQLEARAEAGEYSLIVIDSTGEAMAAGGVDSNADNEVARWFALIKHLLRLPGAPGVLVLDHVPKAVDAPPAFAIGSQRKRAAVTGAAYRVETVVEPAKGRSGMLKLTVAKDRLGNRAKGAVAAMVGVVSSTSGIEIDMHLDDAQLAAIHGERFRPTVYMERVSRWLEDNPGLLKRDLLLGVKGKRNVIDLALETLIDEGWIVAETGPKNAKFYTVKRTFREYDDVAGTPIEPVDNHETELF